MAMAKYAPVDEYIGAMPEPLREAPKAARHVIDKNLKGSESAIKWSHPTWSIGKKPVENPVSGLADDQHE